MMIMIMTVMDNDVSDGDDVDDGLCY